MKSKKGFLRLLALCTALLLVSVLAMAGCSSQQRPEGSNTNDPAAPGGAGQDGEYDTERVRVLEEAINEIDGVDNAYVVLSPDTAWVALELDNNFTGDKTADPMLTEESTGRGPDGSGTPGTTPGAGTDTLNNGSTTPANELAAPNVAEGTGNVADDERNTLTGENGAEMNGSTNDTNAAAVPESLRQEITRLVQAEVPEAKTVYVTADETLVGNILDIRGVLHSGERMINDVITDLEAIGDEILNAGNVR